MKLLIEINAPQWPAPTDTQMAQRNRLFHIGQALRSVAVAMENSQATEGHVNHDGMRGTFEITYPKE